MMKKLNKSIRIFFIISFAVIVSVNAEGIRDKKASLNKSAGSPAQTKFNINNVSTYFSNNGDSDLDPAGNSGFIYPKGSNRAVFFESGLVWGGKVDGNVRVGGSTYEQGLVGGRIINSGLPTNQLTAESPSENHVRIYRVRKDYKKGNLTAEAADEDKSIDEIYAQYEKDWNEWPAQYGAPYNDVDANGTYDPTIDIPGVPGADQTIWYVANDLNTSAVTGLYGSPPIGIEMQLTVWGYNLEGELGNMLFRKYTIINKSDKNIEDMYVAMWSDPDLGEATEDLAGCDTTLSLGYIYNGSPNDNTYGRYVPAAGFDFFQGPIINGDPNDRAIFKNKEVFGKKNLPMTAFFYFINSDAVYSDPPLGEYQGTTEMYNLLQGKIGTSGEYFPVPDRFGGGVTTFPLSGSAENGKGYIDGLLYPPGDRRFGMSSGPFTMAAGDTQEVVVAQMAAGAFSPVTRLDAVGLLKYYDLVAQNAYDNFFKVVPPPFAPVVNVTELNKEIILTWGINENQKNETEMFDSLGYKFEGYNVYQLPTPYAKKEEGKRIATFDVINGVAKIREDRFDLASGTVLPKVTQFGEDVGVSRSISITSDALNSDIPLNNYSKYYFAVTAYAYNNSDEVIQKTVENPLQVIEIMPQSLKPGEIVETSYDDPIPISRVSGLGDAQIELVVKDPKKTTGKQYNIFFEEPDPADTINAGKMFWGLYSGTDTLLKKQSQLSAENINAAPIVDGIQIKVYAGGEKGIKEAGNGLVEVQYAGSPVKTDAGGAPYGGNKVWHSLNSTNQYYISAGGGTGGLDRLYRWVDYAIPRDFELRFTEAGGYGIYAFTDDKICTVPFELWDIGIGTPNDASDDKRMIPFISENDSTKPFWGYANGEDPYFGYTSSDWIYWMDPEGADGYSKFAEVCAASGGAGQSYNFDLDESSEGYWANFHGGFVYPWGRMTVCDFEGNGTVPPAGTTVRIITTKPITTNDVFTFTSPTVSFSESLAKDDVNKINVFPNPYYGVNAQEINKYERFVTFTHLPRKANIKVFNLAGQLVRIIQKEDNTQIATWDLKNESGLPAASGLYIAHVDLPELGKSVIVKLSIIQEQQILDRF